MAKTIKFSKYAHQDNSKQTSFRAGKALGIGQFFT